MRSWTLDTPTGDFEYDNAWGVAHIGTKAVHDAGITGPASRSPSSTPGSTTSTTSRRDVDPEFLGNYKGGYDFFNHDADPMDDNGHGTHVAGILAAEKNNYLVVGVAPGVDLYALKILGATGEGEISDLIPALEWAVDNHMDVVNMSLGTHEVSPALETAVANASMRRPHDGGRVRQRDRRFDDIISGCPVAYPGAYPQVLSTTYTNQSDAITGFSCVGPEVDIAAPGDNDHLDGPGRIVPVLLAEWLRGGERDVDGLASRRRRGRVAALVGHRRRGSPGPVRRRQGRPVRDCDESASTPARPTRLSQVVRVRDRQRPEGAPPTIRRRRGATARTDHRGVTRPRPRTTRRSTSRPGQRQRCRWRHRCPSRPSGLPRDEDAAAREQRQRPLLAGGRLRRAGYLRLTRSDDGAWQPATGNVTVTVTPVNHRFAVVTDDALEPARHVTVDVAVLANDTDVEGDALVSDRRHHADIGDRDRQRRRDDHVHGRPRTSPGSDGFDYTIGDGAGGVRQRAHVAVTVLAVNHPPVAVDDNLTAPEDTPTTIGRDRERQRTSTGERSQSQRLAPRRMERPRSPPFRPGPLFAPASNYNGSDGFDYTVV